MEQKSLETVIGEIVRRLDAVRDDEHGGENDPLRFVEKLAPADSILSALHKEYVEANSRHKKLVKLNGRYDPMTEVAADMLDSARSALQTRLLELQDIRDAETREALRQRMLAKRAAEEATLARLMIERRRHSKEGDTAFWIMVLYWMLGRTFAATRRTLSAANDFTVASVQREKRTSWA